MRYELRDALHGADHGHGPGCRQRHAQHREHRCRDRRRGHRLRLECGEEQFRPPCHLGCELGRARRLLRVGLHGRRCDAHPVAYRVRPVERYRPRHLLHDGCGNRAAPRARERVLHSHELRQCVGGILFAAVGAVVATAGWGACTGLLAAVGVVLFLGSLALLFVLKARDKKQA